MQLSRGSLQGFATFEFLVAWDGNHVRGPGKCWQPWARWWQVLAGLEWVLAWFGTLGQAPGKSWHVQDWSWHVQDWSWLVLDLPRTCPGKVLRSTKTSPPYQN